MAARALQTLQESDLERLFFRFPAQRSEQPLKFRSMGQIACLVMVAEDKSPKLSQFLRIRILVNAVDRRNAAILKFKRDRFISREHKLLDQLMRLIVFDAFHPNRSPILVEDHFHFRKIEIERAAFESSPPEQRRQLPGRV